MKMRPGSQTGFLLCGKEWTDGEAMEVRSPWDQGLVGRVTKATRADARQAVHHAVASLRRTRALPRWKRREILEDVAGALIEQKERFAQLIVAEAGKPVRLARTEVDHAVLTFKTAAEEAARLGGESIPLDLTEGNEGRWGLVQRFPIGPVLAITPFNLPLSLVAHKAAPAIAAGCPLLLKPAPQGTFTALALGEVILKAGWPEEALAVLPLDNADTAWLAEKEDRIKLVSFTGSAKVGWELKAHSGRKRVLLRAEWERRAHRAQRLEGTGRRSVAHRALRLQLRGAVVHQHAARVCGAQHLSDVYLEGGGYRRQACRRRSLG